MAITLYQEQIPFSNKRLDKPISKDGSFTNPVIAPFAFDFTTHINTLETVIYIRNDSQEHYYKNVVVSLMKTSGVDTSLVTGSILTDAERGPSLSLNGEVVPLSFSMEAPPAIPAGGIPLVAKYQADYKPIYEYVVTDSNVYSTDDKANVKLSYGYDEQNEPNWDRAKSILLIPSIGNSSMPDTSYHPIRMRIVWKSRTPLLTIRDYFIDVSFAEELPIGG